MNPPMRIPQVSSKTVPTAPTRPVPAVPLSFFRVLVLLMFCQVWFEVFDLTIRVEDLLLGLMFILWVLFGMQRGRLVWVRDIFNGPLALSSLVLVIGVANTLVQPFDGTLKRAALISAIRLILPLSVFLVWNNQPALARLKAQAILRSVLAISVLTTGVCLVQIAYWDQWAPFSLPAFLTESAEYANTTLGREVFGLFVGDTGTHDWSFMLAVQALVVFYAARFGKNFSKSMVLYVYFVVLVLILVRTSVRNSVLGLFVALTSSELIWPAKGSPLMSRLGRPGMIVILAFSCVLAFIQVAPENYFGARLLAAIPQIEHGRVLISPTSNLLGRFEYWRVALAMFSSSPWIGTGFGVFTPLSSEYSILPIVHAHNSYLQVMSDFGLLGVGTLLCLGWTLVRYAREVYALKIHDGWVAITRRLWLAYLIMFAFTALFANPLETPRDVTLALLLLGILRSASREAAKFQAHA